MRRLSPTLRRVLKAAAVPVLVVAVYALAVGARWWVCATVERVWTPPELDELPFTLESALLFHYADEYRTTGRIPRVDERAQVPEGLYVRRELSVGKGIVAAWLYNGFGLRGLMSFQRFVRRFDAAWYALGVIPLFFLVRGRTRSTTAATIAAVLLACAYTAVQRSTGVEFSRENFALPLIFAHFWLFDMGLRKRWIVPSIVAGVLLAVALATWDMTQLYLLLVVAYCAVRCLLRRAWADELVHLAPTLGAALVAGLIVPYLWAHRFLISYAMLLGYGLAAWWLIERVVRLPAPAVKGVLAAVIAGAMLAAALLPAGKTYAHFRELLFAKIEHANVKPLDPAKLSYDARILWSPALHSATTRYLGSRPVSEFRAVIVLGLAAALLVVVAKRKRREIGQVGLLVTMVVVWLVLYLLFVRLQVFLIFFAAAFVGIGIGAAAALARRAWPIVAAVPIVGLFFLSDPAIAMLITQPNVAGRRPEEAAVLRSPSGRVAMRYGRGFNYRAAHSLANWLRDNTGEDDVVLATFTIEPTIYCDARRPIVINPKFETPRMREKVHEFLEAFYAPSERTFHEFCLRNDVNYFVFSPGLFATPETMGSRRALWVYTLRYVAGIGKEAGFGGTRWMYEDRSKCGYFRWKYDVPGTSAYTYAYRIFEVVSEADIREANDNVYQAELFFEQYMAEHEPVDLDLALQGGLRATELWPGCIDAWHLLTRVYALIDKDTPDSTRAAEALAMYRMLVAQEEKP